MTLDLIRNIISLYIKWINIIFSFLDLSLLIVIDLFSLSLSLSLCFSPSLFHRSRSLPHSLRVLSSHLCDRNFPVTCILRLLSQRPSLFSLTCSPLSPLSSIFSICPRISSRQKLLPSRGKARWEPSLLQFRFFPRSLSPAISPRLYHNLSISLPLSSLMSPHRRVHARMRGRKFSPPLLLASSSSPRSLSWSLSLSLSWLISPFSVLPSLLHAGNKCACEWGEDFLLSSFFLSLARWKISVARKLFLTRVERKFFPSRTFFSLSLFPLLWPARCGREDQINGSNCSKLKSCYLMILIELGAEISWAWFSFQAPWICWGWFKF